MSAASIQCFRDFTAFSLRPWPHPFSLLRAAESKRPAKQPVASSLSRPAITVFPIAGRGGFAARMCGSVIPCAGPGAGRCPLRGCSSALGRAARGGWGEVGWGVRRGRSARVIPARALRFCSRRDGCVTRRAFTIIELILIVLILIVIVGVLMPISGRRSHRNYRQIRDSVQIRSIHQGMVAWAGQNQDTYPIPSSVDLSDTIPGTETQSAEGAERRSGKDLPRFVLALLIYSGSFGPEILVSSAETNTLIRAREDLAYSNPQAVVAAKRAKAILDPSFACYPDEQGGDPVIGGAGVPATGGCSYAFSAFYGARREAWASTFDASEVVIGNRGPWYKLDSNGSWDLDATDKRGKYATPATSSNTLLIHGSRTAWEGNVARNDNSVMFETRPDPDNIAIKYSAALSKAGIPKYDNLFANENESGDGKSYSRADDRITPENFDKRRNNYLRCWGGDGTGSNLTFDPETGKINSIVDFWYD